MNLYVCFILNHSGIKELPKFSKKNTKGIDSTQSHVAKLFDSAQSDIPNTKCLSEPSRRVFQLKFRIN